MKTVRFCGSGQNNPLHIETDGAIINIRVGLHDGAGREVTNVEIICDPGWTIDQTERHFASLRVIQVEGVE